MIYHCSALSHLGSPRRASFSLFWPSLFLECDFPKIHLVNIFGATLYTLRMVILYNAWTCWSLLISLCTFFLIVATTSAIVLWVLLSLPLFLPSLLLTRCWPSHSRFVHLSCIWQKPSCATQLVLTRRRLVYIFSALILVRCYRNRHIFYAAATLFLHCTFHAELPLFLAFLSFVRQSLLLYWSSGKICPITCATMSPGVVPTKASL